MFAANQRVQNARFRRWESNRWTAVWLLVALGVIRSAPGDDNWNTLAPVIELDADERTTLPRTTSEPVLAPVIRGRPAWSKRNDRSPKQSSRIPTETAPQAVARPEPKFNYGRTSGLTEAVTMDLQEKDDSASPRSPASIPSRLIGYQPAQIQQPPIANFGLEPELPQPVPAETVPPGVSTAKTEPPVAAPEEFRPIQQVGVDIAPGKGALPQNRAATRFAQAGEQIQGTGFSRSEPETQFEWDAPSLCHRPLFFEEVNLERHGYHVRYLQPVLSAAHFFGRVPAMPYLAASQRTRVCNYTLGHYHPGSCAPYVWYYPRPSLTGTTIEGAVVAGLILAIP